ncbi:hypothetical protein OnM2_052003 [Erysiphe neolycopersici]|uniref:Uncharacterized protein n=1 Tax=Erysiphe neolycopersici TaxID=212602 RepID=A0A420HS53_9PEZI|nr:hypothetical protein OnM2_052003 [Erysiphe neolycopersici]
MTSSLFQISIHISAHGRTKAINLHVLQHPKINQAKWAKNMFNLDVFISQSMISWCLAKKSKLDQKDREELLQNEETNVEFKQLEESLFHWILQCHTGDLNKEEGR